MSVTKVPPFVITLFGRPAVGGAELTGTLAPTLLSLLTVRANDPVEFDVLIDQVYRYEPPATATKTIQNQIVRLRRALAPTSAELETVGTAYRLTVDPTAVDILAIDHIVADGSLDVVARHRALAPLRPLWHNRPFGGCRPAPLLDARQLHLSRTITTAVELWAEAELSAAADPSSELEWALTENPYAERLWELLVESHRRHGRPDRVATAIDAASAAMAEIGARLPDSLAADTAEPALPTKHTEGGLIGRSGEFAKLLQLLERARAGEGAVALVTGAAGIGKTSLAHAVVDAARTHEERIGWGRCWPRGENPEFWVWRDAFADAFGVELTDALDAAEHDLPIAVRRLTDHLVDGATDRPVVLVLDDVHDADTASLHLLTSMAAAVERAPILVLATARSGVEWADGAHPLRGNSYLESIRLGPWTEADLDLYLRSRAGRQPDRAEVAAIYARSGGNPFVAERVAHTVAEPGDRTDEIDVLLGHHLVQLGPETRTVIEICALAGRPIPLSVLADVVGRPFATSLRAVNAAIAAGFLQHEANDEVDVHHPAVRAAVEHRLTPDTARVVHGTLATALSRDPAALTDVRAVRIAHHALAALAPGESGDRAVRFAEAAGDVSLAATSPSDAAHWYGRAREVVERRTDDREPDRDLLAKLLVLEGRALGLAGRDPDALAALGRAASIVLDDHAPERAASVAIELMRHRNRAPHRLYLPQTELVATAELALAAEPDPVTAAMLHSALVAEAYGRRDYVTVMRHAEAAMTLAETTDDAEATVRALLAWRIALAVQPERTDEWCATTARAARIAEPTGDAVLIRSVDALRLTDGMTTGDLELLVGLGSRRPARAGEVPEHAEFGALAVQSQVATAQGRYADARRHLDDIAEMSADVPSAERFIVAFYARLALGFDVGYDDELVALTEAGARARPVFASRVGLALVYGAAGRRDDARRVLVEECNPDPRLIPRDDSWLFGMSMAAWAAWVVGEERVADALVDVLSPFAHLCALPATGPLPWIGSIGLHAAEAAVAAGRLDEAEALLVAADDMHRRLTVTPWLLRNDLVRGDLLTRRGEVDEARSLLERVRHDASELGADAIAAQAGDLMPD